MLSLPSPQSISMTWTGLTDLVLPRDEGEPVAHCQEIANPDLVARIGVVAPLRDQGQLIGVESTIVDQRSDDGVQYRLGHRPRQELAFGGDGLTRSVEVELLAAVALGEHLAALDDDDGVRDPEVLLREHLVDDRVEFVLMRRFAPRPLARRPGDALRLCGEARLY